ncbi:CGNR zinc finger domain-containing protein [Acetobacter ascendens]|uniref:CGNR zinc finger domain-containing protein n=1 Tax=Acetobacter ascendens TaxID=481146 RepID=UPI000AAB2648|nr:CGNR zinc finger domain-containing protein [Acetobacter ascendens]
MNSISEFRFNSGRLALDLPATVRRRASEPEDVLAASGAPAHWLRDAGLSHEILMLTAQQTSDLVKLREAIWAAADASAAGRDLPEQAVATLNRMAAHPLAVPKLDAKKATVNLFSDDPFQTALATIARDAIDLLGSALRTRIKACEQPDCRMLFLDADFSHLRQFRVIL